jgi:type III secretion protein D
MKQLRILTGIHAGATAPLGPGVYRIDADDDADIRITDWTGPSAIVEVGESDVVTVRRLASEEPAVSANEEDASDTSRDEAAPQDAAQGEHHESESENDAQPAMQEDVQDTAAVFMLDFLPMQFDQSVICIGPDNVEWPSDLALLSTLLKPGQPETDEREARRSRRRTFVAIGAGCVALAVIASVTVLSMTTRAKASLLPNDVAAMENVNREFTAAHLNELRASLDGHGGVLVRGLVTNESENLAARRLLAAIRSPRIQAQYGIAEVIRRGIGESLPIDGISVHYDGSGVFSIAGKDVDMDALQQGVKRIRPDLPSNVKDIRIDATGAEQPDAPSGASYIAIVSSDSVRYAQTPDGVKHIFILDHDDAANGASAANAVSPASDATMPASADGTQHAASDARASISSEFAGPTASRHVLDQPQASVAQTGATLRK